MTKKQQYRYFQLWRTACLARGWNQNDNAKRHQIHVEALGFDLSHKDMDNKQVDRIFCAFRLLADETDLAAVMFFQDPEVEERKRLIWRIEHTAAKRYIETIASQRFGTMYYQDLDVHQLEQLRNTVCNRVRANKKRGDSAPAPATEAIQA